MIALVQRVSRAEVSVGGTSVGAIDRGLLVFVCAEPADTEVAAEKLVTKLLKLRIFADAEGRMNRSVVDMAGGLLFVSQFTLAADVSAGNRPSFTAAAEPARARALCDRVVALARARHDPVATGEFGADMQVSLVNDGPVTIPMRIAG